jgi:S1-C subfamily serine protease
MNPTPLNTRPACQAPEDGVRRTLDRPSRAALNACVTVDVQTTARFEPPLAPPLDGVITINGTASGFLVRGADGAIYVVTAGHHVRYTPTSAYGSTLERVPAAHGEFQKVNSIFVTVYGLGPGCSEAYFYRARLLGVDGAGDIAVLAIDAADPWNEALPRLGAEQPTLAWGTSAAARPGSLAWVVGNSFGLDPRSVSAGAVRDAAYADASGGVVVESMLVTCPVAGGNSGSPILDKCDRVIGMVDWRVDATFGGGPSQRFLQAVVERIIAGAPRSALQVVPDVLGDYWRYLKGFLGISWYTVDAFAFVGTPAAVGGIGTKRAEGLEVSAVYAGGALSGLVAVGDILTHMDAQALGALPGQILPTLLTWRLGPGSRSTFTVRRKSERYATAHTVEATLLPFPASLDRALYGVASAPPRTDYSFGTVRRVSGDAFARSQSEAA